MYLCNVTEVGESNAVYSGVGKFHQSWWTDPKGLWGCKCWIWDMLWEWRFWAEFSASSTARATDSVMPCSCIVILLEKWLRCCTVLLLYLHVDGCSHPCCRSCTWICALLQQNSHSHHLYILPVVWPYFLQPVWPCCAVTVTLLKMYRGVSTTCWYQWCDKRRKNMTVYQKTEFIFDSS